MRANRIEELERAAKTYPLLADLPAEHLPKLLELAEEQNFEQDEIIFREGVKSEYLFLIASGNVALEIPAAAQRVVVQTLGPGDAMGWSSLADTAKTHFQARALSVVQTIAFNGTELLAAFAQDHSLGYEMMKHLLTLVTERLDHVRMQILDIYDSEKAAGR